jgi:hypothetical protein
MDRDLASSLLRTRKERLRSYIINLGLVRSSPLTAETPSDLAAMIQAGMSVTHDEREEPLVTRSDEEHSKLPVLEESCNSESLDCTLSWHCGDHEPFLLESTLEAQEIVEHLPCGLAREEVYVSMDWVDRYMTGMDTLWDTDIAIINRCWVQ